MNCQYSGQSLLEALPSLVFLCHMLPFVCCLRTRVL